MTEDVYEFTNNWFAAPRLIWEKVLPAFSPRRFLEIGSFEGASSCFLIDTFAGEDGFELHCVDTWGGGIEHGHSGEFAADMERVKERFVRNTGKALSRFGSRPFLMVHEQKSDLALSRLLAAGKASYFDFVDMHDLARHPIS